jgi:hypothetical protein
MQILQHALPKANPHPKFPNLKIVSLGRAFILKSCTTGSDEVPQCFFFVKKKKILAKKKFAQLISFLWKHPKNVP